MGQVMVAKGNSPYTTGWGARNLGKISPLSFRASTRDTCRMEQEYIRFGARGQLCSDDPGDKYVFLLNSFVL